MEENNVTSYFDVQDDPFFVSKLSAFYTFAEVARYKSFRAAAQEMYVSPQALNKQITMLEKKFGLPLLQRSPRGFSLTPYGEHVYQYASGLLSGMQQLRRDLSAMYAENNHILRLAYSDNLYDTSLYTYMMEFQSVESNCKMKSKHLNFDQTMEVANGKEPHITITTRPAIADKFHVTVLHDAQYYFLIPQDSPLAKLDKVSLSDLAETQVILCAELFRANQYLLKYCTEHRMSVNAYLETGGFQTGLERCRQSGAVLLMADYIERHVNTTGFIKAAPQGGLFSLELVMLVRKDLDYSPMECKFIKYMQAYSVRI